MAFDLHRHCDGSWFLDARFWVCVMGGYTKGPWSVSCPNNSEVASVGIHDDEDWVIADMCDDFELELVMANARLIASAPELLQELQDVLDWARTERAPLRDQEISHIASAIAKATGEQP